MDCTQYRETVLEIAGDAATRRKIAEALSHVETCPTCRSAFTDFDQIVASLRIEEPSSEPVGGWEAFEQKLMKRDEQAPPIRLSRASHWGGAMTKIAAASLLAAAAFWFGQRSLSHQSMVSDLAYALAPSEVVHDTKAFAAVSDAFCGKAGWILVTDSQKNDSSAEMGILQQASNASKHVYVLRLSLLKAKDLVSSVDLVIAPGESADLTVKLSDKRLLHYQAMTSSDADGQLNLMAEIKLPSQERPLAALSTTLDSQASGKIVIGELQTLSGRYQLRSSFSRAVLPPS